MMLQERQAYIYFSRLFGDEKILLFGVENLWDKAFRKAQLTPHQLSSR